MSTALITGASSGVGLELAKLLLGERWEVITLNRSELPDSEWSRKHREDGTLRSYTGDLSDFRSMKRALDAIKGRETSIDVLFNNAGAATSELRFSPQGREFNFEVNAVAPYVIARELEGLVANSSLKTILNTSSNSLLFVKRFDVSTLERPTTFKKLFGSYASSKLALSLWTREAAREFSARGIEIRSACPGGNKTPMSTGSGMPGWLLFFGPLLFSHPSGGAARLHEAALGPFRGRAGIFVNKGKETPLKFADEGRAMLEKVRSIYEREMLMSA